MSRPGGGLIEPQEGHTVMPENEEIEQPAEPETPAQPAAEQPTEPWADPAAARKEILRLRSEAAKYRTKAKELEPLAQQARDAEEAQKSEQQRLGEQLTAAQERAERALRSAVAAKVEALAAKDFADPEDAAGALDLTTYAGDDGQIDTEAIQNDLAALLKRKPHWAKAPEGPRRPAPDRTQGSSGNGARTPSDPATVFAEFMKQRL